MSCGFTSVWLKGGEHSYEHHEILWNGHQILIPRNWSKMKLRHAISLSFVLKEVKIVRDITNLVCMLVYQMGIQIYDQISIPRNCSQVKLRCTVSLALTLNDVKIAWNVAKVGVHACLSNGKPNLSSTFSFEKLFKSEYLPCDFTRVWLKGGENSS